MDSSALKLLRTISNEIELPLKESVELSGCISKGHKIQYPLAMLIESGYLGMTVSFPTLEGAEKMPEFMGAIFLHINRLEKNENGTIEYNGITSSGSSFDDEKIFIRTKGLLYLDEIRQKKSDRIINFLIGFFAVLLPLIFSKLI